MLPSTATISVSVLEYRYLMWFLQHARVCACTHCVSVCVCVNYFQDLTLLLEKK